MKLEGVFVATVTPFSPDGGLDRTALTRHLERLAAAKVHGLVACGTTGETPTLSQAEWEEVVQATVQVCRLHRLKALAGCGGNCTEGVIAKTNRAKALGCEAVLVSTPYYNRPTQAGVVAHFQRIADRSPLPVVLYNVPGRTNVNLLPESVVTLFSHPNIIGLKEASGNLSQILQLSTVIDLREKSLLAGDDDAFALVLAIGGSGIISASANVAPREFVSLYQDFQEQKWASMFGKQKELLPLIQALFAETNPSPAKFALECLNTGVGQSVRLPLVPVSPETQKRIRLALQRLEIQP